MFSDIFRQKKIPVLQVHKTIITLFPIFRTIIQAKFSSHFKDFASDSIYFEQWVAALEKQNERTYEKITIQTDLGKTQVYGLNLHLSNAETLIIFPGARTSSLFWDLDKGLNALKLAITNPKK